MNHSETSRLGQGIAAVDAFMTSLDLNIGENWDYVTIMDKMKLLIILKNTCAGDLKLRDRLMQNLGPTFLEKYGVTLDIENEPATPRAAAPAPPPAPAPLQDIGIDFAKGVDAVDVYMQKYGFQLIKHWMYSTYPDRRALRILLKDDCNDKTVCSIQYRLAYELGKNFSEKYGLTLEVEKEEPSAPVPPPNPPQPAAPPTIEKLRQEISISIQREMAGIGLDMFEDYEITYLDSLVRLHVETRLVAGKGILEWVDAENARLDKIGMLIQLVLLPTGVSSPSMSGTEKAAAAIRVYCEKHWGMADRRDYILEIISPCKIKMLIRDKFWLTDSQKMDLMKLNDGIGIEFFRQNFQSPEATPTVTDKKNSSAKIPGAVVKLPDDGVFTFHLVHQKGKLLIGMKKNDEQMILLDHKALAELAQCAEDCDQILELM